MNTNHPSDAPRKRKVTFKEYDQNVKINMAITVEEYVPQGHLSRIISVIVDGMPLESLEIFYKGGGRSSYHPKMMIKAWIYGFCERVYTSRQLAKAIRENLVYIWLCGGQTPCFKTLSEFRGERMQKMIDVVFKEVLMVLIEEDYINLDDLYLDGSKWEANANRNKIVWRKNTERYKGQVEERITALLEDIDKLQKEEDQKYKGRDLLEVGEGKEIKEIMSSSRVEAHLAKLQERIKEEYTKKKN